MSRPRKQGNFNLPDNLYRKYDKRTEKTYYTYRNPQSGKLHGLGTSHEEAVNDARALNAAIYTSIRSAALAAIITPQSDGVTVEKVITRHLELVGKRGLAQNTIRNKTGHINMWQKLLGKETIFSSIKVRDFVEILNSYEDRPGSLLVMRSAAIDIWKDAIQEGWADDNIPLKTRNPTIKVKRSRLSITDFQKIHAVALKLKNKWLARAMELALVTAQRREDITCFEFKQGKKSTGWAEPDALCVIQQKTKTKIRIPNYVGVNGWTVGSVIKSCRDTILTRWLVHQNRHHGVSKPGDPLSGDSLAQMFKKAVVLAEIKVEAGKTPPTFHEIRSLAIRLYTEQYGLDFGQAIAGHKNAAVTSLYRDVRGSEWIQVKAG